MNMVRQVPRPIVKMYLPTKVGFTQSVLHYVGRGQALALCGRRPADNSKWLAAPVDARRNGMTSCSRCNRRMHLLNVAHEFKKIMEVQSDAV